MLKISRYSLVIGLALICLVFLTNCDSDINPYKELGVSRNAGDKEIKNSYRKLAKKWHPDKNSAPGAQDKFMRISQAYEILSDSERRSIYDDYGSTQEPRQGGGGGNGYQRDSYDQFFREFHGFGGGGFKFNGGGSRRKSTEEEINKKIYDETILPNSHIKPFLIFSYTEFCYSCMAVDQVWEVLKKEIKNIGFGAGHSDASWNRELSKILGINTVPSIVGIINGRLYHFRGEYTIKNLREFVRKLIPSKLMLEVDQLNFNKTLYSSIEENKVLAVFGSFSSQVTLRYQMPCYVVSNNIKCAFIKLNAIEPEFREFLFDNYHIEMPDSKYDKEESLFVFKENPSILSTQDINFNYKPSFSQKAKELTYAAILQTFEQHKFLNLPRIASTQHFYDLCTSWSHFDELNPQSNKVICVLIPTESSVKSPNFIFNEQQRSKFIKKISTDEYFKKTLQFAYIYYDIQIEFFEKLTKILKVKISDQTKKNKNFFENKIVLLKRTDEKYANFEVYDFEYTDKDLVMKQQIDGLKSVIKSLKKLDNKLSIPDFHDESTQNLMYLIIEYFEDLWSSVNERYFWEKMLGNSSYMMIVFCTILFIWLMMIFSAEKSDPLSESRKNNDRNKDRDSPKSSKSSYAKKTDFNFYSSPESNKQSHYYENDSSYNQSNDSYNDTDSLNSKKSKKKFELFEMTEENYDHFVKKLPNGMRTILLIVNNENKDFLIEKFRKVGIHFSNRIYALRFAYINADNIKSQKWLNEIMFHKYRSLGDENDIDISDDEYDDAIKANLNKLDYENSLIVLAINQQRRHFLIFNIDSINLHTHIDSNIENCLGFDDSTSNRYENKFQVKLSNWLDKLTEGLNMNDKFTVKKWPDFCI